MRLNRSGCVQCSGGRNAQETIIDGSLSSDSGFLDVSSTIDGDHISLIWAETGGPPIIEEPVLKGFGSRLIARSISAQLGGEIAYDWQETGLVVTIGMSQARLAD